MASTTAIDVKALRELHEAWRVASEAVTAARLTTSDFDDDPFTLAEWRKMREAIDRANTAWNMLSLADRIALLDLADPETLRFGPWFEGERHAEGERYAVAADGAVYSIIRLLNDRFDVRFRTGWVWSAEVATEALAEAAARAHDRARRGAK